MMLRFTPDCISVANIGAPPHLSLDGGSTPIAQGDRVRLLASLDTREKVDALQSAMLGMVDDHINIEPVHLFSDGVYAREVMLFAGTTAIGKRHRQAHVCIVSKGHCIAVMDGESREIIAPAMFSVPVGTRNCVHAITDTVWTTVHAVPNECRDIEAIESVLVEPVMHVRLEGGAA